MTHLRIAGAGRVALAASLAILTAAIAPASDWPDWRGSAHNGVSDDTGLVSSWSTEGENLIWHQPIVGRSTPVVYDGRVCALGRVGEKKEKQEQVACWSAETGELLWERLYPVYLTTVPFPRVGWGGPVIDPETGNLYAQLVDGRFVALDAEGETVWERRLGEQFGRLSGYGGRTGTPVVDEDKVIASVISISWGELGPPRPRWYAFDKKTGEVVWTSTPGKAGFADANTQSNPVIAEIGGRRLMICGGADGTLYALDSRTGEPVWSFRLSQRGLNVTPVVHGDTVYMSHSEENVDSRKMGRIVAIDGTGTGDVTETHEKWRIDDVLSGFPSPAFHDGRLYVADNSANLHAIDAENGDILWVHNYGTVGKASPVWADGKIFITQVNGDVVIIEPGDGSAETLDVTNVEVEGGRHAEIYGSPAIAYGRLYVATEAGIFAVGDPDAPFEVTSTAEASAAAGQGEPVALRVIPAEEVAQAGESVAYRAETLDAQGRVIGTVDPEWSLDGLQGELADGSLSLPAAAPGQAGKVVARFGDLEATGRLRVGASLPFSQDFADGQMPRHWLGTGRFQLTEKGGDVRLHKPPADRGFQRGTIYMTPPSLSNYVVQADVLGIKEGRRQPDVGVINSGYVMELLGPYQEVRVQPWAAEEKDMATRASFEWAPDTWYTMKMVVDYEGDEAVARGRIWKAGDPEPEGWTVEARFPLAIREGSPGLTCDSGVDVYYDNVKVMSR